MLERKNWLAHRQYRSWMYLQSQHPLILQYRPKIAINQLTPLLSFLDWVRLCCLVRPNQKGLACWNESSLRKKHAWSVLSMTTLSYYHQLQACYSQAVGHVQAKLFARAQHWQSNMEVHQLQSVYAWLGLAQCHYWLFKLGSCDQNRWILDMKAA